MKTYTRVCAEINLNAIEYNIEQMQQRIRTNTLIIAVIKADGYGHGAVPLSRLLEDKSYIWGFAVATLDEAVVLRKSGIKKPLLVLGCIFPDQYEDAIAYKVSMTVYTTEMAEAISKVALQQNENIQIHIKLDTGMGRLGFPICDKSIQNIVKISKLPNLQIEGIYTHFATADEVDKSFTNRQLQQYTWIINQLDLLQVIIPLKHCSNSAGIIDIPEANFDIVRAGISIYGLYPSEDVIKKHVKLKPALRLTSHISLVKEVAAGTTISYGATFVSKKNMRIATIPVGYADGYPRSLSNKGYVLIHGEKANILGRICMDQFMVDVTEIKNVEFGDEVILIGTNGNQHISVEDLSALSDRFNYEFVCDLSKRIPRQYVYNAKIIEQIDWFR